MPEIIFIRHGKTPGNEEKRYIGRSDESLSAEGIEEIRALRENLDDREPASLLSSPMKRCLETAKILYPEKKPVIVPDLREYDFGPFEGKNYQELLSEPSYAAWLAEGGAGPFPEGEGMAHFKRRVVKAFEDTLARFCRGFQENETCVFVVHGGTIMSIMEAFHEAHGGYYDYQIPNGSLIRTGWDGSFPCCLTTGKDKE